MNGQQRTVTIFDWLTFSKGVHEDAGNIDQKTVFVFLDQVDDSTCRVLLFRAWYHVGGVLKCYVGDRMAGPVTPWVRSARFLIALGKLATQSGVVLQWGDMTDPNALPVADNTAPDLIAAPVVGPDFFTEQPDSSGG